MGHFQLRVVQIALLHHETSADLQHLGPIISNFLGPSPFLSLPKACEFGSTALLDWIRESSCIFVEDRTAGWSVHNYLRSDPHYNRSAFMMSTIVVAKRGDLRLMDWLFTHFSGCEVPVEAVEASASRGDWNVLKYLRDHDAGNRSPEREEERSTHARNVVRWNTPKVFTCAIEQGFPEDALWLLDFEPLRQHLRAISSAIRELIRLDLVEFVESLLPDGKDFLSSPEYALLCTGIPRMVERMLDTGYLNQHEKVGAAAILDLVDSERLDLMQRVAGAEYSPPQHAQIWEVFGKMPSCERARAATLRW